MQYFNLDIKQMFVDCRQDESFCVQLGMINVRITSMMKMDQ